MMGEAMGQVLIRNIDDAIIDSFKAKAALKGHSLEQELRDLLVANAPYTPAERAAVSARYHAASKTQLAPFTLDEIREGLE